MMFITLCLRRKPVFQVRFLSDKITYIEEKVNTTEENVETNTQETKSKTKKSNSGTEKIQQILKSMMEANKDKETTSRASISTPPGLFKKKPNVIEKKEEKIEEKMTAAVSELAAALGGDTKKTEAELLSRVLGDVTQSPTNLSELVMGMKIDRSKEHNDGFKTETRGEQVRRLVERASQRTRPTRSDRPTMARRETISTTTAQIVDISSEKPLGIFKPLDAPPNLPRLETWQRLQQRETALATAQPPRNYFEKMLLWTEQGKVWKFPIDNEQGMEEEAKVHFTEHVLVEQHLEGWCPERGPIRHFMELVCVGLSKNPFYTAQEKKDHIMWFKDYFESKKDLLSEIGALGDSKTSGKTKSM